MKRNNVKRARGAKPLYRFEVKTAWLVMRDGVRLAATMYVPVARRAGQKFPVLLELLPYRKDDTFYVGDYPTYSYFAQRGFITVKVDIRGTGGSAGGVPPREYSDIELDDAEEIIRQLAALKDSNGSVGMWGVSWSGFNSLQVAMRRPPALKAILAMHASDDLYQDDLHYIDGVLHLDPYHLFINHELGLPRTPDYPVDSDYFSDRFDRKPWLFTYLNQQTDGDFWRRKSLREDYSAINIPVYLIGGLLDGYRDTVVRLLEKLSVPVKADIAPCEHSSPDEGTGPNYEWHDDAIRWFEHWLAGGDNGIDRETVKRKDLTVFVRSGGASAEDYSTPGRYRLENWPIGRAKKRKFYLSEGASLTTRPKACSADLLTCDAGSGTAAGIWWGDITGDQRADDATSLVYDSGVLRQPTQIIGFPKIQLEVSSDSPSTKWSIRLEDVAPDGTVALVTGKLVNGAHLAGRLTPADLVPGDKYRIDTELHFTTWTFKPGHRIRLAVSNAQFPMAWPSPHQSTSTVYTGQESALVLPVVNGQCRRRLRMSKQIARKLDCPDGEYIALTDDRSSRHDVKSGETTFTAKSHCTYTVRRRKFVVDGLNVWKTSKENPACSSYVGEMKTRIESARRVIILRTRMVVRSDADCFHLTFVRDLFCNGKRVRRRSWTESIDRQHQ
ncbi:MAG: CocE/NonD family hydrolase [Candidatus Obscuribacterales bacterium]|nr:CocE/NonD family hydrolase [Candidatus Obscuribacterales bacterium]